MKDTVTLRTIAILASAASMVGCATLSPSSRLEIEPQADAVLKAMSSKLAAAERISFKAVRAIDPDLVDGTKLKQRAQVAVDVARPNKFRAQSHDSESTREMFYDGAQLLVWGKSADVYASVSAPPTIDKVIDQIDEMWGVHPPLADLLVADPYRSLTGGEGTAKLVGTNRVNGVACDHVSVTQAGLDWDIWIAKSDSLPRKFVITVTDRPGNPQVVGELSDWNLAPQLPSGHFEPRVGKNSTKIEMIPMN